MKAIIIEDEAIAARRMQRLLEARDIEVVHQMGSLKELADYLEMEERPDVFFMDIHLSDGIVFDLLSQTQLATAIIFTTAYDQYAIKAFKQNSIDYLLKPIDEDELDAALDKLKKLQQPIDVSALSALLSQQKSSPAYRDRISVRVGDKLRSINMSEVQLFYSADKINFLLNADNRSYPIDYSLDKLHKQLDPRRFYRVSRSYIVAIDAITDVVAYSNSRWKIKIAASDEHEIIVARDRVKDFKEWLG